MPGGNGNWVRSAKSTLSKLFYQPVFDCDCGGFVPAKFCDFARPQAIA
jgi:hypothetical protein